MQINTKLVPTTGAISAPSVVHRMFIVDCSWSMDRDLPAIRHQMKNKIPQLTNVGDTVSIVWFASKGQYGTLQEGLEVTSAASFSALNKAIDNFLQPVGCTGFKEPIDSARDIAKRLKAKYKGSAAHMFFMTDGYDNQWSEREIIKSIEDSVEDIDSMTLVEYGWHCNRPLMTRMAESVGASLVFTEGFESYDAEFESNLVKKVFSTKKVEVQLPGHVLPYAFTYHENEILCHVVVDGAALVPEGTPEVHYFQDGDYADVDESVAYAGIYTLAQRMLSNELLSVLGGMGDKFLIDQFNNCFSKQDYSDFQGLVLGAVLDPSQRLLEGRDTGYLPDSDAYTVLDFLDDLAADKNNKFFPYEMSFKYDRISAYRVNSSEVLDEKKLEELTEQMAGMVGKTHAQEMEVASKKSERDGTHDHVGLAKTRHRRELMAIADELKALASKTGDEPLEFTPDDPGAGYSISSLTFNETRPNISIQVCIPGTVHLPETECVDVETGEVLRPAVADWVRDSGTGEPRKPSSEELEKLHPDRFISLVPRTFKTKIFRNYAVVKDGIKHSSLDNLPLSLTDELYAKLSALGVDITGGKSVQFVNAKSLPVVNRDMASKVSASKFFSDVVKLQTLKSSQKVLKKFKKDFFTDKPQGLAEQYGKGIAGWLREMGITDGGFSPKTVKGETKDSYTAKEFKVSVAKCSAIPAINAKLMDKIKAGAKAPTLSESLCVPMLNKYWELVESPMYVNAADQDALMAVWLETETKAAIAAVRELMLEIAKTKFAIIVGHTWFEEFESLEQNSMDVEVDGQTFSCKADLRNIEVAI